MKIFISSLNIPLGYKTPKFPSLYMPTGATRAEFSTSFLYYSSDMWRYMVYWTLIMYVAFFATAGVLAVFNQARERLRHLGKVSKSSALGGIVIMTSYVLMGVFYGFLNGAILGLVVSAIYQAGSLSMSTWIPFCWAIASVLYTVCCSYSTSSVVL